MLKSPIPSLRRDTYTNSLMECLAKELASEFGLSHRMRTRELGPVLWRASQAVSDCKAYIASMQTISVSHALEDAKIGYTSHADQKE